MMSKEQTYLTAHKENGRWYFKEHKTKKPDLQTLLNNYKNCCRNSKKNGGSCARNYIGITWGVN